MSTEQWTGTWVQRCLDVSLHTTSSPFELTLEDLVGLAVRRNPKRAHLLVSRVLGKHVPVSPRIVRLAGALLGHLVAGQLNRTVPELDLGAIKRALHGELDALVELEGVLANEPRGESTPTVIGFAETATSLGQLVAEHLGAFGMHSTRRTHTSAVIPYGSFEETHSHATGHTLLPRDADWLDRSAPVVLVDDELSTGRTAVDLIRTLHARHAHDRYVIASLIDLRSAEDQASIDEEARKLGVDIAVVALVSGRIDLPEDVLTRGLELVDDVAAHQSLVAPQTASWTRAVSTTWPTTVPRSGRHGVTPSELADLSEAVTAAAEEAASLLELHPGESVLVLGTEELMYVPLRIAAAIESAYADRQLSVTFGSTTRSPVLAVDDPGYAIRSAATFNDPEGRDPAARFVYNVGPVNPVDRLLVIADAEGAEDLDGSDGMLAALGAVAPHRTLFILPAKATS